MDSFKSMLLLLLGIVTLFSVVIGFDSGFNNPKFHQSVVGILISFAVYSTLWYYYTKKGD